MRRIIPTEDDEQAALCQCLDLRMVCYCAIPNGGVRHITTARRLKKTGVKAGVPDILIFDAPKTIAPYKGVALEMKRDRGGRLSQHQGEWLLKLQDRGWFTMVCYGAGHAITELQKLRY